MSFLNFLIVGNIKPKLKQLFTLKCFLLNGALAAS